MVSMVLAGSVAWAWTAAGKRAELSSVREDLAIARQFNDELQLSLVEAQSVAREANEAREAAAKRVVVRTQTIIKEVPVAIDKPVEGAQGRSVADCGGRDALLDGSLRVLHDAAIGAASVGATK